MVILFRRQPQARRMGRPRLWRPMASALRMASPATPLRLRLSDRRCCVGRGWRLSPAGRVPLVSVRLRFALCGALLFHLLHPFDRALVGARENALRPCPAWCQFAAVPRRGRAGRACRSRPAQLPPDARRRFRNDGMRQRSHNAQRLRRGVQDCRQPGARVRIFLFGERPRLVLDDVLVDGRDERPTALSALREKSKLARTAH